MAWEGKESAYLMAEQFGVSAEDILAAISELDGQTFSIDGTLDATDIFNQLVAIVGDTEKAAKLLEAFANIKVKPITKMNYFNTIKIIWNTIRIYWIFFYLQKRCPNKSSI